VFAAGLRDPAGVCVDPDSGTVFEVDRRPNGDVVNLVAGGASYGWPAAGRGDRPPLTGLPPADRDPGGCAVQDHVLYVTSLDGHALLAAAISAQRGKVTLGRFSLSLVNKYGRLRTVVAAPDGALWLTTSNRDGHGDPVPTDERVLRIVPSGGSAGGVG
jgi:glucose/arabinose dehydrogenase